MSCFFISEKYVHLCWISLLLKLFTYSGDSCTGIVMLIMRYGCHVSELLVFGFSYPSLFLQDIYLKYLGWTLNDKVRDFFFRKGSFINLRKLHQDDTIILRQLLASTQLRCTQPNKHKKEKEKAWQQLSCQGKLPHTHCRPNHPPSNTTTGRKIFDSQKPSNLGHSRRHRIYPTNTSVLKISYKFDGPVEFRLNSTATSSPSNLVGRRPLNSTASSGRRI